MWIRVLLIHLAFALSGAALALSYSPFGLWPLAWFALVPALYFCTERPPVHIATGGFVLGFVWSCIMLSWFWHVFKAAPAVSIILWSLIGLLTAAALGIIAQIRIRWGERAALVAAAPVWLGVDFFRSEVWPLKFAWISLGYSQHSFEGLLQVASFVGVYGITLLVVGFAAACAYALRHGGRAWLWAAGYATAMLLSALTPRHQGPEPTVRVAGAQLEFPSTQELLHVAASLAERKPDIIVIPEYAAVGYVNALHRPGLTTIYGSKMFADGDFYSSAVVALADGTVGVQHKSVPVPLLRDGLPARERKVFSGIGVGICYDMDFTFVSNDLVSKGARLLVYPTMDHSSWTDKQRVQHAMVTPFRAVEHRRWVVRVASSGVSQIVDPNGRVTVSVGTDAANGILEGRVALSDTRTIYAKVGWVLPWMCLGATAGLIGLLVMAHFQKRTQVP